jgi:hypothetical protein
LIVGIIIDSQNNQVEGTISKKNIDHKCDKTSQKYSIKTEKEEKVFEHCTLCASGKRKGWTIRQFDSSFLFDGKISERRGADFPISGVREKVTILGIFLAFFLISSVGGLVVLRGKDVISPCQKSKWEREAILDLFFFLSDFFHEFEEGGMDFFSWRVRQRV